MDAHRSHDSLRTAWTLIRDAQCRSTDNPVRRQCLEYLAVTYLEPVKAMMRTWGLKDHHQIEDCVQEYFSRFIEKRWLDDLDKSRGRFRAFLKVSVRRFLTKEYHKERRRPRVMNLRKDEDGSGVDIEDLGVTEDDLDAGFNRAWAKGLMARALEVFEHACRERRTEHYLPVFERHVLRYEELGRPSYRDTAAALGMGERDVDNYLLRGRRLFAGIVRDLVRETVDDPADVDTELSDFVRHFVGADAS